MSDEPLPNSEIILYQTEDGRTLIQCRFENETLWLTPAPIRELFEKDVRTINEHLVNIFDEGELRREANIRKFRIFRTEGKRNAILDSQSMNTYPDNGPTRVSGFQRSRRGKLGIPTVSQQKCRDSGAAELGVGESCQLSCQNGRMRCTATRTFSRTFCPAGRTWKIATSIATWRRDRRSGWRQNPKSRHKSRQTVGIPGAKARHLLKP